MRALGDESDLRSVFLASLWHRVGQEDKANTILEELRGRAASDGGAQGWLNLVHACAVAGEYEWTLMFTEEALVSHRDSPHLLWERANALMKLERFDEALPLARRAEELGEDANILHILALTLAGTGRSEGRGADDVRRREEALELLERARAEGLDEYLYESGRATVLRDAGEWEKVRQIEEDAAKLRPGSPIVWSNLGTTYKKICFKPGSLGKHAIAKDSDFLRGNILVSETLATACTQQKLAGFELHPEPYLDPLYA